ncbi:MAG: cyclopropane-fatty-acyl-phospholipid synthase family protein [Candidatus Peribacteraceae bacterium]
MFEAEGIEETPQYPPFKIPRPNDNPDVARKIGELCAQCVQANVALFIEVAGQTFHVGVEPTEEKPRSTLVFATVEDFLRSFGSLRIAGVAEGYLQQRVDFRGDPEPILEMATTLKNPILSPLGRMKMALLNQLSRFAPVPAAPEHYNLPPEVFQLFLGKWQKYTGNWYWEGNETLDEAEEMAMRMACSEFMDVPQGGDHLEIGCGWGGQMEYIHRTYESNVTGITDCPTQAAYTRERLQGCGIEEPDVRVGDFAEFPFENAFDTISAAGCLEHIQPARQKEFFSFVHRALKTDGRFFLQSITRPRRRFLRFGTHFLQKHVFPGFHLVRKDQIISAAESAGLLCMHDTSNCHDHYRQTLRHWTERLIHNRDKIVALVGERKFRVLLAYIAMSSKAFERGAINLYRFSFEKSCEINDRGEMKQPSEDVLAKPGLNVLWIRKWMEFHSGINPPREGEHWKKGDKVPRFPIVPPPPEGINPWAGT